MSTRPVFCLISSASCGHCQHLLSGSPSKWDKIKEVVRPYAEIKHFHLKTLGQKIPHSLELYFAWFPMFICTSHTDWLTGFPNFDVSSEEFTPSEINKSTEIPIKCSIYNGQAENDPFFTGKIDIHPSFDPRTAEMTRKNEPQSFVDFVEKVISHQKPPTGRTSPWLPSESLQQSVTYSFAEK